MGRKAKFRKALSMPSLLAEMDGVSRAYRRFDCTGLSPIEIAAGSIGPQARVLGAALLPLIGRFSPDMDLLVKTARQAPSSVRFPA